MKVSTIAFTENGMEIAGKLSDSFEDCEFEISRCARGGLSQWTEEHFTRDAIVFIGAMGIAVSIFPYRFYQAILEEPMNWPLK